MNRMFIAYTLLLIGPVSLFSDDSAANRDDSVRFDPSRRLLLVTRPTVVKELELSMAESAAVKDLVSEHRHKLLQLLNVSSGGTNGPKDGEDLRGRTDELANECLKSIQQKISADQYQRLQQIHWQLLGGEALLDPDVAREISLSDEQRNRVIGIVKDYRAKRRAKNRDPMTTLQDPFDGGDGLQKERDAAIAKVLSSGQSQIFGVLKGREIDLAELRQQLTPRRTRVSSARR